LNAENSALAFDIPIERRTIFPLIGRTWREAA
jgi:hypothetical protein